MSEKDVKRILAENPVFAGLDDEHLEFLAQAARSRRLEAGESLFCQGDRAERFFLLTEGEVRVEIPAIAGPMLEVQRLGPGKVLGWSWLLPPYKWSFQARAYVPSEVLEFDGKTVLERCEADARFGYALIRAFSQLMAERLDAAHRKMMDQWSPPGFA